MRVVRGAKCPREVSQNQRVLMEGWVYPVPTQDSSRAVNRDITQHRALTRKIIVNIDFLNRKIYRLNTAVDGGGNRLHQAERRTGPAGLKKSEAFHCLL